MLEKSNTPPRSRFPACSGRLVLATIIDVSIAILQRQSQGVQRGNALAVHAMRVGLTRLRAAFLLFSPLVDSSLQRRLDREMRWLAKRLGDARDADVAIERGMPTKAAQISWTSHRLVQYQRLNRALKSKRYKLLLEVLTRESKRARELQGPKSKGSGNFIWKRLNRWVSKIVRRGKRLDRLGNKKIHRLRLRAKRLRYAAEWCLSQLPPQRATAAWEIQKSAKLLQQTLGDLVDAKMHRATARRLKLPELPGLTKLGKRKARRRALKSASRALHQLHRASCA